MPAFIILGWVIGASLATLLAGSALTAFGFALPALILSILNPLFAPLLLLSATILALLVMLGTVIVYVIAYLIATNAIAAQLPALTGGPVSLPLSTPAPTPGAADVSVPPSMGESFARGVMIGLTAGLNLILLSVLPIWGPMLGGWAFLLISMGAIPPIAASRVYQGFLGWSAWLFPISWLATAVGLALFILNFPLTFTALGVGGFRIDWTTGVVTSTGGILTIFNTLSGGSLTTLGFSLGNFVFLATAPAPFGFTSPSTASHETGHSLNTALLGGIVLWINWVDENMIPVRLNLAYGELAAQGHSFAMPPSTPPPPAPPPDYSVMLWY